ncbi:hypothetical protein AB835_13705 [Candidatus Endobugula sertula]|uniref:Pyruvate/ketoisovalerate oxidoreductase catalytic domain-containing protein n=1 Tax=Candidatus Endobugula sertula TaxID=62101 RepID=A0A1D2QLR6_9GAMM|nr:hypothetical protein AB835_13705 [Candidatus Endobugula sertula]
MKNIRIIFSGLGGDGIMFIARLLAKSASIAGHSVIGFETHGMAQRGAPVYAHLILGNQNSSIIRQGTADILIAMDVASGAKLAHYIKVTGNVLIGEQGYNLENYLDYLYSLPTKVRLLNIKKLATSLGSKARYNLILLGNALNYIPIDIKHVILALSELKTDLIEHDEKLLKTGYGAKSFVL